MSEATEQTQVALRSIQPNRRRSTRPAPVPCHSSPLSSTHRPRPLPLCGQTAVSRSSSPSCSSSLGVACAPGDKRTATVALPVRNGKQEVLISNPTPPLIPPCKVWARSATIVAACTPQQTGRQAQSKRAGARAHARACLSVCLSPVLQTMSPLCVCIVETLVLM